MPHFMNASGKQRYQSEIDDKSKAFLDMLLVIAKRSDSVDNLALLKAHEHLSARLHRADRDKAFKDALGMALIKSNRDTWATVYEVYDT